MKCVPVNYLLLYIINGSHPFHYSSCVALTLYLPLLLCSVWLSLILCFTECFTVDGRRQDPFSTLVTELMLKIRSIIQKQIGKQHAVIELIFIYFKWSGTIYNHIYLQQIAYLSYFLKILMNFLFK